MIRLLPSDGIRHFAAHTGLLRQHDPAAVGPQPPHRPFHSCACVITVFAIGRLSNQLPFVRYLKVL